MTAIWTSQSPVSGEYRKVHKIVGMLAKMLGRRCEKTGSDMSALQEMQTCKQTDCALELS